MLATPTTQTITFDEISGEDQALNGEYPTDVIDWGTGKWWHSAPWNLFTTKSLTFNGSGTTSGTFTFISPKKLVSVQAYNGGGSSTTVTLSCAGNTNKVETVDANTMETITTGWTNSCTEVTFASTNGWDTNYDNLVISPPSFAVSETNIAPTGTGYRWYGNTSANSDNNKTAATGINDENYSTDVTLTTSGADDDENAWEGAGVTWSATQSAVTKVTFKNGSWDGNNNGAFTANFKLQFTTDGSTWADSGWSVTPAYAHDSSSAGDTTYTFTGSATDIKGARVVGQVRTSGSNSWHAKAKELEVITEAVSLQNIANTGTAYRWSQNDSATSNSNKVAASGLNDGNEGVDVDLNNGSDDNENAWEAAGVVWAASQSASVSKVEYINGTWDGNNNGAFTANFKLQFSYDGTTWVDSDWNSVPAYDHDNSAVSGKKYTFTGDESVAVKGVRVTGQVRTSGSNSWHAFAREIKIYTDTAETAGTIVYDANGNMTQEGNKCYEYNEANELTTVKRCSDNQTIAEYVYDYTGIRLIKKNYTNGTLANTVISWTKSFETKAIVGGSTETTNYFFANRELVAKKKPDGSKQYYHSDHLGSTTVITNQAGTLVEETEFGPWGEVLSGGTESKYQYTGQEKDQETGLNYYNARYYNPELKRFTQPDEVIQDIYDPQNLNRYSYVRNNPLKYTDPSGKNFLQGLINTGVALVNAAKAVPNVINNVIKFATSQQVQNTINTAINTGKNFVSNTINTGKSIVTNVVDNAKNTGSAIIQKITGGGSGSGGGGSSAGASNQIITKGTDSQRYLTNNPQVGWKVGQPINNLTTKGNDPSWSTVRQRFWKNEAANPIPTKNWNWSSSDLERMRKGLAPQQNGRSLELDHWPPQRQGGLYEFNIVTHEEHLIQESLRRAAGLY